MPPAAPPALTKALASPVDLSAIELLNVLTKAFPPIPAAPINAVLTTLPKPVLVALTIESTPLTSPVPKEIPPFTKSVFTKSVDNDSNADLNLFLRPSIEERIFSFSRSALPSECIADCVAFSASSQFFIIEAKNDAPRLPATFSTIDAWLISLRLSQTPANSPRISNVDLNVVGFSRISTPANCNNVSRSAAVEVAIPSVSSPASASSTLAPRSLILIVFNAVPVAFASCVASFAATVRPIASSNELPPTARAAPERCKLSPRPVDEIAKLLPTSFNASTT